MKRKGVSPLIATVLLIVFTVAISTIVVSWLRAYTADTTSSVGDTSQEVIECAKQNLRISNAYITINTTAGAEDIIRATLKNTGSVNFTVSSAYVYDIGGGFCSLIPIGDVSVGAVENLRNDSGCEIFNAIADFSRIEITTTCGVSTDFDADDGPTISEVS